MKKRENVIGNLKSKFLSKESFVLFGVFLLIGIIFFVSLSVVKSGDQFGVGTGDIVGSRDGGDFSFGIGEIFYALAFAFLLAGLLIWAKSIMLKNAYLGSVIGIVSVGVFGYGFSLRYRGFYSTTFMVVTGAIVLGFLGMNFYKFRKYDKYIEGEYND